MKRPGYEKFDDWYPSKKQALVPEVNSGPNRNTVHSFEVLLIYCASVGQILWQQCKQKTWTQSFEQWARLVFTVYFNYSISS